MESSVGASLGMSPLDARARRYADVRARTVELTRGLEPEDMVVQSMPDASPTKWHLGHTTWFFETFVVGRHLEGYRPFREGFEVLFNSYYVAVGERHPRPRRGMLTRPTFDEVVAYRRYVDEHVDRLLGAADSATAREIARLVEIGEHHEQQHQELMLTDVKHLFSCNPTKPGLRQPFSERGVVQPVPLAWRHHDAGVVSIGTSGPGFHYDNEAPRHRVFLEPFAIADRLVTNGEYLDFVRDGGYRRPELWLDEGWATVCREGWAAPIYWERVDREYRELTLAGVRDFAPCDPVCHLSYFEADAYARWAGARLPTEAEWETACGAAPFDGSFADAGRWHPMPCADGDDPRQAFGEVWQWTSSAYGPYPAYRALDGALGEYNGKFMCGQYVLRGASCLTPRSHARSTYRNFFYPASRWQMTGVRLAKSLSG